MKDKLLQLHCENKSAQLFGALDALQNLNSDEQKLVLKSLKCGNTQPLTKFMESFRTQLAAQMSD